MKHILYRKIVCKVRFICLRTGSLCLNYMPICKCFAPKPQNTINNLKIEWKGELTYQRKMKFWRKWSSFCMLSNRSPLRLRSIKSATLFARLVESSLFARKLNEYAFISLIGSEVKWDEGERGRRGERGVKGDGVNVTLCHFLFAILAWNICD